MNRTFVVGDIHGALRALQQLISRINPVADDKFILLGDYVDGWPESAQVIEFLLELQKQYSCVFIKGNHDLDCELWLEDKQPKASWLERKGLATLQSYQQLSPEIKASHFRFLSQLPLFHIDEQERLFLHAGFTNNNGPLHERPQENLTLDRSLWELALTMDKRVASNPGLYPKRLKLFKQVFIGHTPTLIQNSEYPMWACNVCNMDTGAGYFGKLSAMEVNSGEVIQSDPVPDLYPGLKGRM